MGRLAILGALHEEIADLLAAMDPGAATFRIAMRDFHVGTLWGTPCVIALSRIGKVAAAATACIAIQEFKASRVIFTGLAGGLHADVEVGDVVVASAVMQYDMDARPLFGRHEIPLLGRERFDADPALGRLLQDSAALFARSAGRGHARGRRCAQAAEGAPRSDRHRRRVRQRQRVRAAAAPGAARGVMPGDGRRRHGAGLL